VAGDLTQALTMLLRQPVQLVVAGRTDAGVHAQGQVAHLDVGLGALRALTPRSLAAADDEAARTGLVRRLAGVLPPDVRVRSVTTAPEGFDARFSALRRHYRYRVGTADWGVEPRDRRYVFARRRALDTDAMARAGAALIGLHDFAAFCRPREGASTTRELQALTVTRSTHPGERTNLSGEVWIDVVADAFCHSMVRALVGSLLAVGEGREPVEQPAAALAAGLRTSAIHVAPAHGLTLLAVEYPPDAELALRAELTRARRS
jgi:tRNA pseudouridine38-40 synthase